ncbi:MAG: class I SAM-dependent methyltransferase [Methylobacteriaceae bacterium]|nr:class I SAM-dependent methyltransferase [Methylobacteriaceae bacterium]
MHGADWYYDDRRQVGIDFADEAQVDSYDARQGNTSAADRKLLAKLGVRDCQTLADIGCGTGGLACEAAQRCSLVHAIDVSAPMLQAAKSRAACLNISNLRFQLAGFLSFDLPARSLDWVTTRAALHHLPDFWKGVALTRVHAALKTGGRLYIEDVVFSCSPDLIPQTVENWAAWMTANTGYMRADVATHVREEHSTFSWIMEGLIERAGFRLLDAEYEREVYGRYVAQA